MSKIKICIVPECDSTIENDVIQRKYCPKCRNKRNKALFFLRVLRKEVKKLSDVTYDYDISIKYLENNLILVAQHKKDPAKEIKYIMTEQNDMDTAIMLKYFYKSLNIISTKGAKHQEIL